MRGGTSKGVFFRLQDLPKRRRCRAAARDALLLRVIGSPDPYGKQIDGMGGATSSTSKTVILSPAPAPTTTSTTCSARSRSTSLSWTGAATAATCRRPSARSPSAAAWSTRAHAAGRHGDRAHLAGQHRQDHHRPRPVTGGEVQETGDFELDGVTFPAAEVQLEFMDPAAEEEGAGGSMFPTGNLVDELDVPGLGTLKATMINAGIPTIFVNAEDVGYTGTELQDAINGDPRALAMFETIRAHGAVRMGLIKHTDEAASRQHTPKVAFVARPLDYTSSSGKQVAAATSTCSCARSRWASCTTR
jgi:2-methylaconitate cis-trans-isomerase PrpF